jgi:hypothetical protein
MKLKRSDLLPILQSASKVAKKATTLPALSCVLLSSKNGKLYVSATDTQQRLIESIDVTGDIQPVCLNANRIADAVRYCGDDVEVSVSDNKAKFESPINIFSISGIPAKDFPPELDASKLKAIGLNSVDLALALETVLHAASDEEQRAMLQTVHVEGSGKEILATATCGRVLCQKSVLAICAEFKTTIPSRFVACLVEALKRKGAQLFLSSDYVMVRHDSGEFWVRLPELEFPTAQIKGVLSQVTESAGEINVDAMRFHLNASLIGSDDFTRFADIDFSGTGITLNSNTGNHNYSTSLKGDFKPVRFRFDQLLLLRALERHKEKAEIFIQPFEPKNLLMIKSDGITSFALSMIRNEK